MNRLLLLAIALAAPAGAQGDVEAARIARIERATVPAVVLADAAEAPESLAAEMTRLHVPGVSVAVIRGGRIAWTRGYGVTHAGGPPVAPDTLFQAASISKPVTAVAVLRLAEQGRIDLDGDIDAQLTSWQLDAPAPGRVTPRQLLSHTAGVGVHGFDGYPAGAPVPTLAQVLDGAAPANSARVTATTPPGTVWSYSGGGYTVVQQLLIDRTSMSFPDLMRQLVLDPAGMTKSSFAQPLPADRIGGAALPHDAMGKPVAGGPHTYPELAAAGLWTTASDLARFAIAIQRSAAGERDTLLSRDMARQMLTPGLGHWGLGLELRDEGGARSFAHGGANAGYMNYLVADVPDGNGAGGNGAVVMTNGDQGSELAQDLIRSIAREYRWSGFRPVKRRAVALAPALMDRLAGSYAIAGLGTFTVGRDRQGLTISLREGSTERLYAASPTELFILSQDARLILSGEPGPVRGRVVSGAFDLAFTRSP